MRQILCVFVRLRMQGLSLREARVCWNETLRWSHFAEQGLPSLIGHGDTEVRRKKELRQEKSKRGPLARRFADEPQDDVLFVLD